MDYPLFHFKKFSVVQQDVAHPVGTDGVLLGAWADVAGSDSILDIGTGTGLIALMLAQRTAGQVPITGIELHPGSATCAALNYRNSPWADKLEVRNQSIQEFASKASSQFDLIVSNPPFFTETTSSPNANRQMSRHTNSLSTLELLDSVARLLKPTGKCCLILPEKEAAVLCEQGVLKGLYCSKKTKVKSKPGRPVERVMLQLERDPGRFAVDELVIRNEDGGYSEGYKGLTEAFYLEF